MDGSSHAALQLSQDLSGVSDRVSYLRAANAALSELIPVDSLGWVGAHLVTRQVEICGTEDSDRPEIIQALARSAPIHPMWQTYLARPEDVRPRRMSDLIALPEWKSHQVYQDLFVPLGTTHQATAMLAPLRHGVWNGWAFNRAGTDFTDAELDLIGRLQPMLVTLNRLSCLAPVAESDLGRSDDARARIGLTRREVEVLELLAEGFSATSIARIHRVSPRTVRKHLEHIYAKIGRHDRLQAVDEARRIGLLQVRPRLQRGTSPTPAGGVPADGQSHPARGHVRRWDARVSPRADG